MKASEIRASMKPKPSFAEEFEYVLDLIKRHAMELQAYYVYAAGLSHLEQVMSALIELGYEVRYSDSTAGCLRISWDEGSTK